MSDTEKIFAINNYLCTNASYDFDSCSTSVNLNELSTAFIDAHTPYGILCSNYGVCESYSEAFALIGRYAGLNVIMEVGTLQGGGHEWNRVCVDGSWCIVDVTNNDYELGGNALLNVTEEQVEGTLIPDGSAYMNTITSTDDTKEYYYINNMCANSFEEAVEMLIVQLKSSDTAQLRLPVGSTQEEAVSIIKEVANKTQKGVSNGGFFANVVSIQR